MKCFFVFGLSCHFCLCQNVNPKPFGAIPFSIKNNLFVLQYTINGKNLNFVYDTGAGVNIIDACLASSLGINPSAHKCITWTFGGTVIEGIWSDGQKKDSILKSLWVISERSNFLDGLSKTAGVHIDGFLGYNEFIDRFVIEYNFEDNHIYLYNHIPDSYKHDDRFICQVLYPHPYYQKNAEHFICIKGIYTVLDTVQIEAFCVIDTGSKGFLFTLHRDSILLKKMLNFRKEKIEREGKGIATTYLSIPGLLHQKPLSGTRVIPQFQEKNNSRNNFPLYQSPVKNFPSILNDSTLCSSFFLKPSAFPNPYFSDNLTRPFISNKLNQDSPYPAIDIFLGVSFIIQYKKVVIDWRNKIAYFMQ